VSNRSTVSRLVSSLLPDLMAGAGITMLGVGLWWLAPWLSLTVTGALLLVGSALLSRTKSAAGGEQ